MRAWLPTLTVLLSSSGLLLPACSGSGGANDDAGSEGETSQGDGDGDPSGDGDGDPTGDGDGDPSGDGDGDPSGDGDGDPSGDGDGDGEPGPCDLVDGEFPELVDLWNEGVVTDAVWRLRSDGSHLYWVDQEAGIGRVALDGSGAEALFVGSGDWQGYPDLELTDTHVYWIHQGDPAGYVRRVPKAGGMVETLVDSYVIDNIQPQIEVADGWVYFESEDDIYRFAEDDPGNVQLFVSAATTTRLEVDGTHLYGFASNTLRRYLVADPGAQPTTFFSDFDWYDDPTLRDGVLATVHNEISIPWDCSPHAEHYVGVLQGETWTPLASGLVDPSGVGFDGSYVYWSNGCNGDTFRVSVGGGNPEPLGAATTGGDLPKVIVGDTLFVGRGAEIQCRALP